MSRLALGLWLLSSIALANPQVPESGRYGGQLSIASSESELTGWLDRSDEMAECRVYLYAKAIGNRWQLLLYAPAYDDVVLGALEAEGNALRLQLTRAPRGCEDDYRVLTAGPVYRLSQPRQWQSIALTAKTTAVLERAAADATVMQQLDDHQPWATTASRGRYHAGLALSRDGGIGGWIDGRALLPALATSAMRERMERPLPGLSAPSSLSERRQWQQMLDWSSECEARFQKQRGTDGGLALIQFAPQYALLRISCGALSYQDSFIYAWIRLGVPEQTRLLQFPGFSPDRGETRVSSDHSLVFGLDEVQTSTQTLLLYSKWRSTGDCGQLLRFKLALDGPELTEWRERSCEAATDTEEQLSPLEWSLKAEEQGDPESP